MYCCCNRSAKHARIFRSPRSSEQTADCQLRLEGNTLSHLTAVYGTLPPEPPEKSTRDYPSFLLIHILPTGSQEVELVRSAVEGPLRLVLALRAPRAAKSLGYPGWARHEAVLVAVATGKAIDIFVESEFSIATAGVVVGLCSLICLSFAARSSWPVFLPLVLPKRRGHLAFLIDGAFPLTDRHAARVSREASVVGAQVSSV